MIVHLLGQLDLDGVKELPINNGRLLARQDLTLECDLSNLESVAEQVGERSGVNGIPPTVFPVFRVRTLVTMPRSLSSAMSRLRLPSRW